MSFSTVTSVVLLAVLTISAKPNRPIISHEGVGYSVLNHTVQPLSDACSVTDPSQVSAAVESCSAINVGSFSVPVNYQPLIFRLNEGTALTFTGEIIFEKHEYTGYLMEIIGSSVNVYGTETHLFHGQGELYWDTHGGAGSPKPTFMYLRGTNGSSFIGLSIKNCPERCVAIDGANDIYVGGFLIDNRDGDHGVAPPKKEGHNTDGFDIDKSQNVILSSSVVYNQDDCVAINSGTGMIIDNFFCIGSHGFDIATGMSTTDVNLNKVDNITFQNSFLYNGMYGLHILTCSDGGEGYVSNVLYYNITFDGPYDYGIMIQQDFSNAAQGSTGHPTGKVPISNVQYIQVQGSVNGEKAKALSIRCAENACSDIVFDTVSITGATANNECWNYTINEWC